MLNIKKDLEEFIKAISSRSMYRGTRIPESIMKQIVIEEEEESIGVVAPYWIGVLQKGRGPRRSTTNHGLEDKIYNWMAKKGLFRGNTEQGKRNEARRLTWYINKHGNEHFRNGVFIDIYKTEREKTINRILEKHASLIKISTEVIL